VIRVYRGNLLEFLLETEYADRQRGDRLSAEAWFEIAAEAAEILREQRT
jgi:hypothetical protein